MPIDLEHSTKLDKPEDLKSHNMITRIYKPFRPLVYLGCALAMFSCSGDKPVQQEVIRPVVYQKVLPGGGETSRVFTGTAKSGTETSLSFKVNGNIRRLNVKVGQEVNANSLIATLDDSDYKLQYEQNDAAVKNADAQEKNAKSSFERVRSLYENGNTALSDYETAKAQYESAKANESSVKKTRKLAKAQLSYCMLYSPVKGKIATVDAEVNENIQTGQQIVMINSEGDLEVNLGVPESFISKINVQDAVEVEFTALTGKKFNAVVSEVSFAINRKTSTYPIVIKLEDNSSEIRPGMAANVTFKFASESESDQLIVSAKAVGEDQEGNFVFVLAPEEDFYKVERRSVNIGLLTSAGFEIASGLEQGELIATAGLQTLLDGMKVKLFEN